MLNCVDGYIIFDRKSKCRAWVLIDSQGNVDIGNLLDTRAVAEMDQEVGTILNGI